MRVLLLIVILTGCIKPIEEIKFTDVAFDEYFNETGKMRFRITKVNIIDTSSSYYNKLKEYGDNSTSSQPIGVVQDIVFIYGDSIPLIYRDNHNNSSESLKKITIAKYKKDRTQYSSIFIE